MLLYSYIYINTNECSKRWRPPPKQPRSFSTSLLTDNVGAFNSSLTRDIPIPVNATTDQLDQTPLSEVNGFKEIALPWYADQVLPFDVTIAGANEYGAAASAKLFGVEILNEGFGTSVDDSVLEQQATFVARSVLLGVIITYCL